MAFVRPYEVAAFLGFKSENSPKYNRIYREDDKELRQYPGYLVARTKAEGNYENATKEAFRRLSDYAAGENERRLPVPFCRPVFLQKEKTHWTVSIVLPERLALGDVPQPVDPNIEIKKIPPQKVAVIEYGLINNIETIKVKELELLHWLGYQVDFAPLSPGRVAQYDMPFSIPLFRHNEIQIDVRIT